VVVVSGISSHFSEGENRTHIDNLKPPFRLGRFRRGDRGAISINGVGVFDTPVFGKNTYLLSGNGVSPHGLE